MASSRVGSAPFCKHPTSEGCVVYHQSPEVMVRLTKGREQSFDTLSSDTSWKRLNTTRSASSAGVRASRISSMPTLPFRLPYPPKILAPSLPRLPVLDGVLRDGMAGNPGMG